MKLQPPEVLPASATCFPQLLAVLAQSWMGGWDVDPLFGASAAVQPPSPLPETQTPGRGGRQMLRVRICLCQNLQDSRARTWCRFGIAGLSTAILKHCCSSGLWEMCLSSCSKSAAPWLPAQCSIQSLALTSFVPKSIAICIQWNKLHYTCL